MAASNIRLDLNEQAIRVMLNSSTGEVGQFIRRLGMRVANEAQRRAPVDTGRLRSSIGVNMVGGGSLGGGVEVAANISYALDVHEGMKPHVIKPKGKMLKFPSKRGGAKMIYAKKVNHPGTKPNPFLWDALREVVTSMSGI